MILLLAVVEKLTRLPGLQNGLPLLFPVVLIPHPKVTAGGTDRGSQSLREETAGITSDGGENQKIFAFLGSRDPVQQKMASVILLHIHGEITAMNAECCGIRGRARSP